jgi:hypothetical protein
LNHKSLQKPTNKNRLLAKLLADRGSPVASAVQACNSMGVQKRLMSSRPRDGA